MKIAKFIQVHQVIFTLAEVWLSYVEQIVANADGAAMLCLQKKLVILFLFIVNVGIGKNDDRLSFVPLFLVPILILGALFFGNTFSKSQRGGIQLAEIISGSSKGETAHKKKTKLREYLCQHFQNQSSAHNGCKQFQYRNIARQRKFQFRKAGTASRNESFGKFADATDQIRVTLFNGKSAKSIKETVDKRDHNGALPFCKNVSKGKPHSENAGKQKKGKHKYFGKNVAI